MTLSIYATEAIRRDRLRRDRKKPGISRQARLNQQHAVQNEDLLESLTAALFQDHAAWLAAVQEAGLQTETVGETDVAYAESGKNRLFHGYCPREGGTGYLDVRATYPKIETMMSAIKECIEMKNAAVLSESALTSYFKRDGLTVEVDGDDVTVWAEDNTAYADACDVASGLGSQIGEVSDHEDGNRFGIKFKLLKATYPSTGLDHDVPENDNHIKTKVGVNTESRRRLLRRSGHR